MIPDVPAAVLASVRSTSDRPIPHPRQEPTMTAPRPSPAGLSPLLDQLDEARAKGTPGEWRWDPDFGEEHDTGLALTNDAGAEIVGSYNTHCCSFRDDPTVSDADAELIVAAVNALPQLTAALRAVLTLADDYDDGSEWGMATHPGHAIRERIRAALTAALTPGADTTGATA